MITIFEQIYSTICVFKVLSGDVEEENFTMERDFIDVYNEIMPFFESLNDEQVYQLSNIYNKFENLNYKSINIANNKEKVPSKSGLYLLGNTNFNSNTNNIEYYIKVGYSMDLQKRINNYYTYNPTFSIIDFHIVEENDFNTKKQLLLTEKICHFFLNQIKINILNKEWFEVSEEDYNQITNEKFSWFGLQGIE